MSVEAVETRVTVRPARYVKLPLAEAVTGFSVAAMETKIARGVWLENREYVRAPDKSVLIDLQGYELWAAGQRRAG